MRYGSSVKKLKLHKPYFLSKQSLVWVVGFAAIGVVTLIISHAATSSSSIEPEDGAPSSGITQLSDPGASGGKAIKFGTPAVAGNGCGLTNEVFCENFEEGSVATANRLRSGDIDSNKISGSRMPGTPYPPNNDYSVAGWIRPADIPAGCRSGSITNPLPPDDALICEPNSSINSRHALIAVAAQNYGDSSFRIGQEFDFANRTGKIAFNSSIYHEDALYGGAELTLTDEPLATPSIIAENGNGASPRNGIIVHFVDFCNGAANPNATVTPRVKTYSDYNETIVDNEIIPNNFCSGSGGVAHISKGKLNRVEVRISNSRLEIWASDFSNDGVTFGPLVKIFAANISLSFTRGWVAFGGHNHATEKYGSFASWNTYWDNIAFDGPTIAAPKVYQVPDSGTQNNSGMVIGYPFGAELTNPTSLLTLKNVQAASVSSAKLTFNVYMEQFWNPGFATRKLDYRLNGGPWHQFLMPAAMASTYEARHANRFNYVLEIDKNELVNGNNTVQFAGESIHPNFAPFVANVDLIAY